MNCVFGSVIVLRWEIDINNHTSIDIDSRIGNNGHFNILDRTKIRHFCI